MEGIPKTIDLIKNNRRENIICDFKVRE